MFRQALADLKDRYPQRLQVIHLFSQESMDSDLLQGRIDGDKLSIDSWLNRWITCRRCG